MPSSSVCQPLVQLIVCDNCSFLINLSDISPLWVSKELVGAVNINNDLYIVHVLSVKR